MRSQVNIFVLISKCIVKKWLFCIQADLKKADMNKSRVGDKKKRL